jgi:hypothetical protein
MKQTQPHQTKLIHLRRLPRSNDAGQTHRSSDAPRPNRKPGPTRINRRIPRQPKNKARVWFTKEPSKRRSRGEFFFLSYDFFQASVEQAERRDERVTHSPLSSATFRIKSDQLRVRDDNVTPLPSKRASSSVVVRNQISALLFVQFNGMRRRRKRKKENSTIVIMSLGRMIV